MVPSSLLFVSGATKSSRQIAHVGCEKAVGWYDDDRTSAGVGRAEGEGDEDRLSAARSFSGPTVEPLAIVEVCSAGAPVP